MNSDKFQDSTMFDPPVRTTDDGRYLHFSIDLPGVVEEQIRIDLEKTTCTLCILKNEKMVKKAIRVPQGARFFQKKFSDGVLEIFLEKPAQ
jgi:HSP20 family molecular chaperone IbpA